MDRISFVWNADFSLAGGVRALGEVISGQHTCSLCEIAYHRVRQTSEWKAYKEELAMAYGCEIREPCKNQLEPAAAAVAAADVPTVLAHTQGGIVRLLGGAEIDGCDGDFQAFRAKLDMVLVEQFGLPNS